MIKSKKLLFRLITLTLGVVMAFSMAACGDNGDNNSDIGGTSGNPNANIKVEDPKGTITTDTSIWDLPLNAVHEINVRKNMKDFIVNGTSEYKIVYSENTYSEAQYAAEELKTFLKESTGCELPVVSDAGLSYNANAKYISVGETSLLKAAGITVDKATLGTEGYRIKSKDNSVFLVGGGAKGTLYSAYGFLEQEIALEVYAEGEIYYEKNPTLKLHDFDVTDVPDFEYRMCQGGASWNNTALRYLMRFDHEVRDPIWMGPDNVNWHNTLHWMPKAKYQAAHPKWYMDNGADVCFNAHGDEAEAEAFLDEFMNNFIKVINANPDCENVTITQMDHNTWCSCAACEAEKAHYGTNAGTIVKFCNKVSERLEQYFKANNIDRRINICFFAYQKTTAAPVIKNDKGEYVPIDDEVICRDNVCCYYAPILAAYLYGFNEPENWNFLETMEKWATLSKKMYLWIYHVNFSNGFTPYNAISSMQSTYIVLKNHGCHYLYDQGWCGEANMSGWDRLRAYLVSKLSWNVKADYRQLVNDFMEHYYKNAAGAMKKAFDLYETWFAYLRNEVKVEGSYTSSTLFNKDNFTKGFVDGMLACFDEAYAAIEPLKDTDAVLYDTLKNRICLETLQYRYLNIEYHKNYYTEEELLEMKQAFQNDVRYVGLTKANESQGIDVLYKSWGIQ